LTAIRFVLALLFPFLPARLHLPAIAVALASEFFDGYTARKFNAVTRFGQIFDPVADKLFIVAAVFVLLREGAITPTHLMLVCVRDFVVTLGTLVMIAMQNRVSYTALLPRKSGKITTALQFIFLICLFLNLPAAINWVLLYVTAVSSCVSAVDYLYAGVTKLSAKAAEQ
jgi:CDP-diacylglycerol--glycerol-3-phosphate 3-phosphatidyltransferase